MEEGSQQDLEWLSFFFLKEINQDSCKKLLIYNGKKKERKGYKKRVG